MKFSVSAVTGISSAFERRLYTGATGKKEPGESFPDVPTSQQFYPFVETLFHNGITGGCGGDDYCPVTPVTRGQMAVFLLKSEHGNAYAPPACTGVFQDVPCPSLFGDFDLPLWRAG